MHVQSFFVQKIIITCCIRLSVYEVLQEDKNLKSLLSGRSLLNSGVGSVLTVNLAGAVGRNGEVDPTHSYDGWLIADETNDSEGEVLKRGTRRWYFHKLESVKV